MSTPTTRSSAIYGQETTRRVVSDVLGLSHERFGGLAARLARQRDDGVDPRCERTIISARSPGAVHAAPATRGLALGDRHAQEIDEAGGPRYRRRQVSGA